MIAPATQRVLITDDNPRMLEVLRQVLTSEGYQVSLAQSGEEALGLLRREQIHLVLSDLSMPTMDGIELTREVRREWPNTPVMILTGEGTIESAVEAMRVGSVDFLTKPIEPQELLVRVARRLEERSLRTEVFRLSAEVRRNGRFGEIIGVNRAMREIFSIIERVAGKPSQVLIQGENGTGKELIARAIHRKALEGNLSPDLDPGEREQLVRMAELKSPYVPVNCGAFARSLLESQLFGHKKGSFTGAVADQEGVFAAAQTGVLFLDEITELDIDLQVKLLRAIQEREVTPIGSTRPVAVSARIICATNQDIAQLVREERFREDLFYRINIINISVPPLRERVDDIPLLVDYFLRDIAENYGVGTREIESPVLEAFQIYTWPGNVRELRNVIERAFALGQDDEKITLDDLPPELLQAIDGGGDLRRDDRVFKTYDQIVREHIVRSLQATGGVKSRAASLLEIDRNRLYRLMRRYGIQAES